MGGGCDSGGGGFSSGGGGFSSGGGGFSSGGGDFGGGGGFSSGVGGFSSGGGTDFGGGISFVGGISSGGGIDGGGGFSHGNSGPIFGDPPSYNECVQYHTQSDGYAGSPSGGHVFTPHHGGGCDSGGGGFSSGGGGFSSGGGGFSSGGSDFGGGGGFSSGVGGFSSGGGTDFGGCISFGGGFSSGGGIDGGGGFSQGNSGPIFGDPPSYSECVHYHIQSDEYAGSPSGGNVFTPHHGGKYTTQTEQPMNIGALMATANMTHLGGEPTNVYQPRYNSNKSECTKPGFIIGILSFVILTIVIPFIILRSSFSNGD